MKSVMMEIDSMLMVVIQIVKLNKGIPAYQHLKVPYAPCVVMLLLSLMKPVMMETIYQVMDVPPHVR
jgi:hypothetical protein